MKSIKIGFLLVLLTVVPSSYGMAGRLSGMTQYVPSWQTVRESLPPVAYWPGIGAVAASTLALNPFDIRNRLGIGHDPIRRKIATLITLPYALPYSLPQYFMLKRQFLAFHGLPEKALEDPGIQAVWEAYVNTHLLRDTTARKVYWHSLPAALLLGGHLYHTYR